MDDKWRSFEKEGESGRSQEENERSEEFEDKEHKKVKENHVGWNTNQKM